MTVRREQVATGGSLEGQLKGSITIASVRGHIPHSVPLAFLWIGLKLTQDGLTGNKETF